MKYMSRAYLEDHKLGSLSLPIKLLVCIKKEQVSMFNVTDIYIKTQKKILTNYSYFPPEIQVSSAFVFWDDSKNKNIIKHIHVDQRS